MKKNLSIGIVCYPSIGGSGIIATNLGNELAKQGHRVHFISYEKPFRLNLKSKNVHFHKVDINEYSLFKYPDYTLPLAVTIDAVHQKYQLDILHVHYAVPHATGALLAKQIMERNKIKPPRIITTLHGTDIILMARDPSLRSVIKYSVENSDGVTAVSSDLKKETQKVLKTKKKIEVIYNFFAPKLPKKSREVMRNQLGIKANEFLALHMSNLRSFKRIPDLLKIVAKINRKQRIKLLILAGGSFNKYIPLVKKLKIEKKIIVKKNVFDVENYINTADLGLYTSDKESFGLGILETMAYGKPVIATKAGGVPEVVRNKKDGLLFPIGDTNNFVKALQFLTTNPKKLKEMGRNAAKRARSYFSTEKMVKKYLNYYQKVMQH